MNLSPRISLDLFTDSFTVRAHKIDNQPKSQAILDNLTRLANEFERVVDLTGGYAILHATDLINIKFYQERGTPFNIITCAYRSPAFNVLLPGAAKHSAHMDGRAIDFHPSSQWTHDAVQQALKVHPEIITDRCLEERDTHGGHWLHFQIPVFGQKPARIFKDLEVTATGTLRVVSG